MNGKLVAALLVGLAVGLFAPFIARQQEAQGQKPEKVQTWEYKAVGFTGTETQHANTLKKLTDEGWEYVGLLSAGDPGFSGSGSMKAGGTVAFRRPAK